MFKLNGLRVVNVSKTGYGLKLIELNRVQAVNGQDTTSYGLERFGLNGLRVVNGLDTMGYELKWFRITWFLAGLNGFGLKWVELLLGSNSISSGHSQFGL